MVDATDTDAQLLARHVAGDPAGFTTLVERHRNRLWAVALRTLGDPDDAADAVQNALVSAYRGAAGFRGDSAVTTWLHRIVVNACMDLGRRRAARPTETLGGHTELIAESHNRIGERETSLSVLAALRQLPAEQAAAVVLVDVEGFPVAEAAEILDVPVGTVKSRCARARARLAALLGDLEADPTSGNGEPATTVQPAQPRYGEEHR